MLLGLVPLALILAVAGGLLLVAARQPWPAPGDQGPDDRGDSLRAGGRLATRMTDGFDRTARAVDVLVERRGGEEVLRTRESDPEQQRATYVVLGGGLLGLSGVLVLGLALLLVG